MFCLNPYLCTYVDNIVFGVTGTSAGVGFAIPSSTVTRIVPQLIQYGKVCSVEFHSFIPFLLNSSVFHTFLFSFLIVLSSRLIENCLTDFQKSTCC